MGLPSRPAVFRPRCCELQKPWARFCAECGRRVNVPPPALYQMATLSATNEIEWTYPREWGSGSNNPERGSDNPTPSTGYARWG
jgi:hypothetical protein